MAHWVSNTPGFWWETGPICALSYFDLKMTPRFILQTGLTLSICNMARSRHLGCGACACFGAKITTNPMEVGCLMRSPRAHQTFCHILRRTISRWVLKDRVLIIRIWERYVPEPIIGRSPAFCCPHHHLVKHQQKVTLIFWLVNGRSLYDTVAHSVEVSFHSKGSICFE